jgi:hypothetical protein
MEHSMVNHQIAIANFSKALNVALIHRFGKIPSAMSFATKFNLRAYGTNSITRETARKWIKGLALPEAGALQLLIEWLGIDPINIFSVSASPSGYDLDLLVSDKDKINAMHMLRKSERLAQAAIESVSPRIAVLDMQGKIILVNQAWRAAAFTHVSTIGQDVCEGADYLDVCDRARGQDVTFARAMALGIRNAISDETAECFIKYPCHTPNENRWFTARITSYRHLADRCIVIYHESIGELEFNHGRIED